MAKSLGGGFPISGVVGRAEVMDAPNPGGLGGTYAGSPIAVAAARAVIDAIEEENLCDRASTSTVCLAVFVFKNRQTGDGFVAAKQLPVDMLF